MEECYIYKKNNVFTYRSKPSWCYWVVCSHECQYITGGDVKEKNIGKCIICGNKKEEMLENQEMNIK
jgi:hypothetical protein